MLALQTISDTTSYAQQANSYYNNTANNCITLDQRFNDTLSSMPQHEIHWLTMMLNGSYEEFIRTTSPGEICNLHSLSTSLS